jgi:hypothetical protein
LTKDSKLQVIYSPGTFGNCLRWLLDRFTFGSNFKDHTSPWDHDQRVHGFKQDLYMEKFEKAHQIDIEHVKMDKTADKIVISYEPTDLLFVERCGFYRNVGNENNQRRFDNIVAYADQDFVNETFGDKSKHKSVAKELKKIQFHDHKNHKWWSTMEKHYLNNQAHFQFPLDSFCDATKLKINLIAVSEKYNLQLIIDDLVIENVVQNVMDSVPVKTRYRADNVLQAINDRKQKECGELDIVEQAYIETILEKQYDNIIFPYGTNWFADTDQINEFIDTYPTYLKHMNPRLPWYNGYRNPFYLSGKIDKSK